MSWPSARISTEPVSGRSLDGTLIGTFYIRGGQSISNLYSGYYSLQKRFKVVADLDYFEDLPKDVLWKLVNLSYDQVRRLVYTIRAVEDSILISTPELANKPLSLLHLKLWRWVISTSVHSYTKTCTSWKALVLHLRHRSSNSHQRHENVFPRDIPGHNKGGIGSIWYDTFPWLKELHLIQFGKLPTKDFMQRIGTFCQTRHFPPPPLDRKRFEVEVREWRGYLTRKQVLSVPCRREAEVALNNIFKCIKQENLKLKPHISLSASACFNNSRSKGGRVIDFLHGWINDYVKTESNYSHSGLTLFGAPYSVMDKVPLAYTMARKEPLSLKIQNFLNSAFRSEFGTNTTMAVMFGGTDSNIPLEEPIFGLDQELPLQLLQYAIERAISQGYINRKPYFDPVDYIRPVSRVRILAKAHPVCEPGNKVRWVTMEESFMTVILQPFAHWMAGIFQNYEPLRSAFTRSYKAWDACVALQRYGTPDHLSGIGTFDLTGASNNLNKEFLRIIGQWAIRNYANDAREIDFYSISLDLMLRDREIRVYDREDGDLYQTIICDNGVLMGNPGTKELLCMSSAVLHIVCSTRMRIRHPPYTLIAGDDVILYCRRGFFDKLLEIHRQFGNDINMSKTIFSSYCNYFAEEAVLLDHDYVGCGKSPWDKGGDGLHVDVIKLRLLSPFGVQSLMSESTFKNPSIGKANALQRVFTWFPNESMKVVALHRFQRWMSDFIKEDPLVYMPRKLGGYGIPYTGDLKDLLSSILDTVDPSYYRIFELVTDDEVDYHSYLDFVLKRMASGNTVRGLIDPMSYELTAQYGALAVNSFFSRAKSFAQFGEELQSKKTWKISGKDIFSFIRKSGYIGYHDIADNLDRLTAFRIALVAAAGHLPLEDFIPQRDTALPSPSEVLTNFVEKEVKAYRVGGFSPELLNTTNTSYLKFRTWLLGGMEDIPLRVKQIFVPSEAMIDSLAGMRIPIPYVAPKEPIKGSVEDFDVDPTIEGWTTQVVSLRRVN